jgi:hypothetical protein
MNTAPTVQTDRGPGIQTARATTAFAALPSQPSPPNVNTNRYTHIRPPSSPCPRRQQYHFGVVLGGRSRALHFSFSDHLYGYAGCAADRIGMN